MSLRCRAHFAPSWKWGLAHEPLQAFLVVEMATVNALHVIVGRVVRFDLGGVIWQTLCVANWAHFDVKIMGSGNQKCQCAQKARLHLERRPLGVRLQRRLDALSPDFPRLSVQESQQGRRQITLVITPAAKIVKCVIRDWAI